ncbi:hypothetical protein AcW1_008985 [Taiwanofungus camphoratus]|nr:hypothetical protein AcV5_007012 [Antrodia cinnamomea]KAI0949346.1 hypothetical protein AcW1_008985 [Antrodia cinnamomea]
MSDVDVQQVRDAVAKRRAEAAKAEVENAKQLTMTAQTKTTASTSAQSQPFVAAEDAKRKREAMTRDERLGLR